VSLQRDQENLMTDPTSTPESAIDSTTAGQRTFGLPALRQVVLLTGDLEASVATARDAFGFPPGVSDPDGMAAIGFRHQVFGFDRTFVEICQPLDPESAAGRRVAAAGDGGFMVVVQVDEAGPMLARASALGLRPLLTEDFHGSPISQWHPRDFGTMAEFDQMIPADSWHLAPEVYAARSTAVARDVRDVTLEVADPPAMAQRWAAVTGGTVLPDSTAVRLTDGTVTFRPRVARSDSTQPHKARPATFEVVCAAADPSAAGRSIRLCGVDFVLT
jgi:catechol 2,3-dioxygenase-like lactoylglutathione lyase family enzyme